MAHDKSSYDSAIQSLSGKSAFTDFERFVRLVARFKWPQAVIQQTPDGDGNFDLTVKSFHTDKEIARIEAKAWVQLPSISKIITDLKAKFARNQCCCGVAPRGSGCRCKIGLFFATTFALRGLEKEKVRKLREELSRVGIPWSHVWDAEVLGGMAFQNRILASVLPVKLPTADEVYLDHSLQALVEERKVVNLYGVNLLDAWTQREEKQLREHELIDKAFDGLAIERSEKKIGSASNERKAWSNSLLIHGPPHVGKTHLAVTYARNWLAKHGRKTWPAAFYLNATKTGVRPELLLKLSRFFVGAPKVESPCLFIVDDLHAASYSQSDGGSISDWFKSAHRVSQELKNVRFVWIARDELDSLYELYELKRWMFPLDSSARAYLGDTIAGGCHLGCRTVIALSSGLSPGLILPEESVCGNGNLNEFTDKIIQRAAMRWIERFETHVRALSKEAKFLFYLLLPFASIADSVELDFLARDFEVEQKNVDELKIKGLLQLQRVFVKSGRIVDFLALTIHPFHARKYLLILEEHPDRYSLQRLDDKVGSTSQLFNISQIVVRRYLKYQMEKGSALRSVISSLASKAEWSGVRRFMAQAFSSMSDDLEWTSRLDEDTRRLIIEARFKLTRGEFFDGEDGFKRVLQEQKLWWQGHLENRSATSMWRPSHVLYEIAHIEYLQENYAASVQWFAKSESAAVESICVSDGIQSKQVDMRRRLCLAHVWVSATMRRIAKARLSIQSALRDPGLRMQAELDCTTASREVNAMAMALRTISTVLAYAYRGEDVNLAQASDELCSALESATGGSFSSQEIMRLLPRTEGGRWLDEVDEAQAIALARHETNTTLLAVQVATWPKLFLNSEGTSHYDPLQDLGNLDKRSANEFRKRFLYEDWKPGLDLPANPTGVREFSRKQIALQYRWAFERKLKPEELLPEVVAVQSLRLSGGGIELLGDLVLLSLRLIQKIDPGEVDPLAHYFLRGQEIPNVGCNGVAKEAARQYIRDLQIRGQRGNAEHSF